MTISSVTVHPLVLLSVVDHYTRTAKSTKKRVLGILLGQKSGSTVNVANSFAVPFEEDDKDSSVWFLDHDYFESMFDMFRKVNAKEKMVGWYHSGPKLRQSDLEINELLKKYIPDPVLVIVDVQSTKQPTSAYHAIEQVHDDGTPTTRTFMHLASTIEAEEAEEIGVEHLLRDITDSSVGTLSTTIKDSLESLKGLHQHLLDMYNYLQKVVQGEYKPNHQIMSNLQDLLNLLPNVKVEKLQKSFTAKTNDEYLVLYLGSLVRSIIALHNLIDNKAMLRDGEFEKEEKNLKAGNVGGMVGA